MRTLLAFLVLTMLPFGSSPAQGKVYVWSTIDPGWKNSSLSYWSGVKGYGKAVPTEMSENILEYHRLENEMLGLVLKEKFINSDLNDKVIVTSNPGSIALKDVDLYLDLQCRILEVTDKYPYFRTGKLGIEPVIAYSYTIYDARGGIVATNEIFDRLDYRNNLRYQVRGLSDHRRDIELVRIAFTESLKGKTIERVIGALREYASVQERQGVIADELLFRKVVGLVFDSRRLTAPNDYSDINFKARPSQNYAIQEQESTVQVGKTDGDATRELDELIEGSRYYALIIGINNYRDPAIQDLEEPVKDAMSLYNTLAANYTFEEENITFLKSPTRNQLIITLDSLARVVTEKDNLLVFYAGHGIWDELLGKGFWLPSDATAGNRANWFSNSDLRDYIGGIKAKHTLLISDACFSGGIFKTRGEDLGRITPAVLELYKLPSRKAMTSGAMKTVPDKSVFLRYLVQRLEDNTNYFLSSEKLFASFKEAVINNSPTNQVPQFGEIRETGDEGGDFLFIRRKNIE